MHASWSRDASMCVVQGASPLALSLMSRRQIENLIRNFVTWVVCVRGRGGRGLGCTKKQLMAVAVSRPEQRTTDLLSRTPQGASAWPPPRRSQVSQVGS
jgi:hypothetical protein